MLVIMIVFFTSILHSSTGSSLLPGYDEGRVSLECPWSVHKEKDDDKTIITGIL